MAQAVEREDIGLRHIDLTPLGIDIKEQEEVVAAEDFPGQFISAKI